MAPLRSLSDIAIISFGERAGGQRADPGPDSLGHQTGREAGRHSDRRPDDPARTTAPRVPRLLAPPRTRLDHGRQRRPPKRHRALLPGREPVRLTAPPGRPTSPSP